MTQLIIKDLDYCHIEDSELKGGSNWLVIDVGVATAVEAGPPNSIGVGGAVGAGIGLGYGPGGTPATAVVNVTAEAASFPDPPMTKWRIMFS